MTEHQHATTLDLVGEQVWRGAIFLADFLLNYPDIITDTHVLELASGVGLTSIVAAMIAKKVTVTGMVNPQYKVCNGAIDLFDICHGK